MPKRFFLFSALTAAFLVTACAETGADEPIATPGNSTGGGCLDTLYSYLEQPENGTRAKLSQDPSDGTLYHLNWEADDVIKVICAGCTEAKSFTLLEGEGTQRGTFQGTYPSGTSDKYYAVLNYSSSSVTFDGDNLILGIAKNKAAWANNIPSSGIPAVAKIGSDGAVGLRHIFGLLQVTFSSEEEFSLKKLSLHDLAGNMLWGYCSVPVSADGELDCEHITMTGGDNTITMTLNTPKKIGATPVSYFLPVPQGALDGGFSIVLYEADDTKSDGIGRAYTFMQKISGTKAMPRAGILAVNAPVAAKPEAYDAKGRGYYKSLFVNAGYGLDSFGSTDDIPAIGYMGLVGDCEYYSCNKTDAGLTAQTSVIVGNDADANGVLLYPDGSPRFRLVFNSGGSSTNHGKSLGYEGRRRFYNFFNNGGSYSSVCAGSFLAATSVDGTGRSGSGEDDFTYGFIPVNLQHTSLPYPMDQYKAIYTNMEVLSNAATIINGLNGDSKFSLLLGGTDTEGNIYTTANNLVGIKDVTHHGGGYLPSAQVITGMEALMKYRFSTTVGSDDINPGDGETYDAHYYRTDTKDNILFGGRNLDGYYSTWAYKPASGTTGRAVCTGSHPEGTGRACDNQFAGFMFRYAMEGNGEAIVKSNDLTFGQTRYMNSSPASYDSPASNNAGIGDRQYHHFKFTVPTGGYDNIRLILDSEYDSNSGIDLYLGLRKGDLAWLSAADYTLCNKGGQKEIHIKHLPAGTWYVSVFCATTVTATERGSIPKYFEYTGKTQVLNGVPYSISIAKDCVLKDYFPVAFGDDFTDSIDD